MCWYVYFKHNLYNTIVHPVVKLEWNKTFVVLNWKKCEKVQRLRVHLQFIAWTATVLCSLCVRTARPFADHPVRAISAGVRHPPAAVALDQEAGIDGKHRERHLMRFPVGEQHLGVFVPHKASLCDKSTKGDKRNLGGKNTCRAAFCLSCAVLLDVISSLTKLSIFHVLLPNLCWLITTRFK